MTTQAIVLGCGIAGLASAAALADQVDEVTIIERDQLPDTPAPRDGVPQGRHLHGLLSSGAEAMEALVPGTLDALWSHGANRVALGEALLYGPLGWMCPCRTPRFIVAASRPLTEFVFRSCLQRHRRIRIIEQTLAVGLLGTSGLVTGVRVRHRNSRHVQDLAASLVIDATGRTTRTPRQWLPDLGLPEVESTVVDPGLAYSSFPARMTGDLSTCINLQPDSRSGLPGRGGFVLQIEANQWMFTLSGTRGAHPPRDDVGLKEFALRLRDPLIADLLVDAERTGRIWGYQNTSNRRYHYERVGHWPRGLLVLGDAATAFNPVYGQGMSVAAMAALTLRTALQRRPPHELDYAAVQKQICRTGLLPWWMCTTEDIRYPGATGPKPSLTTRLLQRAADRLRAVAATDPAVACLFYELVSLSVSGRSLISPSAAVALIHGPRKPAQPDRPSAQRATASNRDGSPTL
ncbi:FAD-dependent monooxygenase [Nocardia sp. NBC_00565]|uniref:FAD-dependent monooxygenase n=1 Tax=Nocardia sp. NBC_00565 TaxID=2975993 RepID=UPI002E7FBDB8|nr:FAD-dependent monooxygenase [Nocardia sp. NBC_00565]WUC06148.1 FAD-dependent monooxygenase [Nocardia sp. NBC_00565]